MSHADTWVNGKESTVNVIPAYDSRFLLEDKRAEALKLPMHGYEAPDLISLLEEAPEESLMVFDSISKAHSVYSKDYERIIVGISGGSDSDLVIDLCKKMDPYSVKTIYVWVDTGLEFQATKNHLDYLEKRYGVNIERIRPKMPIPVAVKKFGQPFISKQVSEFIYRLQSNGFKWEDEPFDVLIKRYPRCKSALEWWCDEKGEKSRFTIRRNKYLKEFLVANPPQFKIANKCCQKSKKDAIHQAIKDFNADLDVVGIRKAEGGARGALKACFVSGKSDYDVYRPIFWYQKDDKTAYENTYDIKHSECYDTYGLPRTGCCGCPFGRDFEKELEVCDTYEPKLAAAVRNVFGDSYEYTRRYREFIKKMDEEKKAEEELGNNPNGKIFLRFLDRNDYVVSKNTLDRFFKKIPEGEESGFIYLSTERLVKRFSYEPSKRTSVYRNLSRMFGKDNVKLGRVAV